MQILNNLPRSEVIFNTARITVRPHQRKEFCQTVASLLVPLNREAGCRSYRFYQEATDENSFIIVGEWESRTDWDNFLRSDDFAILIGTIMVLNCHSDTDFRLLRPVAGLERLTTHGTMN